MNAFGLQNVNSARHRRRAGDQNRELSPLCFSMRKAGTSAWKMTATTIVERWRAIEVLHLVAVCEGDFTQRKPR